MFLSEEIKINKYQYSFHIYIFDTDDKTYYINIDIHNNIIDEVKTANIQNLTEKKKNNILKNINKLIDSFLSDKTLFKEIDISQALYDGCNNRICSRDCDCGKRDPIEYYQ